MRQQPDCYLESLVRCDLKAYDSLSLRIKRFKRSKSNPEVTCIVVRLFKYSQKNITIHAGISYFHKLTEYGPKVIGTRNPEIVGMIRQVIDTRDYKGIGLVLDRMVELSLIPAHPYWYTQWVELVNTYCVNPTQYVERVNAGLDYHRGNILILPDMKVVGVDDTFRDEWETLETEGFVDTVGSEIYYAILAKWIAADRPRETVHNFIMQNYF